MLTGRRGPGNRGPRHGAGPVFAARVAICPSLATDGGGSRRRAGQESKNRSLLSTLCRLDGGDHPNEPGKPLRRSIRIGLLVVVQSAIWAVVLMATARTLAGTEYQDSVRTWLIAGWFASYMLPLALLEPGSVKAECAWLRQRI